MVFLLYIYIYRVSQKKVHKNILTTRIRKSTSSKKNAWSCSWKIQVINPMHSFQFSHLLFYILILYFLNHMINVSLFADDSLHPNSYIVHHTWKGFMWNVLYFSLDVCLKLFKVTWLGICINVNPSNSPRERSLVVSSPVNKEAIQHSSYREIRHPGNCLRRNSLVALAVCGRAPSCWNHCVLIWISLSYLWACRRISGR